MTEKELYEQLIMSMLSNNDSIAYALERIDEGMINSFATKSLFKTIKFLFSEGKTISKSNIHIHIHRNITKEIDYNKFENYLNYLYENRPELTIEEIVEYIIEDWKEKEIKKISNKLNNYVTETDNINLKVVNSFIEEMNEIIAYGTEEPADEILEDIFEEAELIRFKDRFLSDKMVGLMRKNIHVIGAEERNGKTTMSIFILNDLLETGHKVLFIGIEPTLKEIIQKLVSLRCGIDSNLLIERQRDLTSAQKKRAIEEKDLIKQQFLDTGQLIIKDQITDFNEIKIAVRKHKPDVFIIDPIQGIEMPKIDGKEQAAAFGMPVIMQRMKNLCKITNSAALLTAWVSAGSSRPKLEQMYASKSITKWSTKTWLLWFPFNSLKYKLTQNVFELIEGKQRNAKSKIIIGKVIPEYGLFTFTDKTNNEINAYKQLTNLKGDAI
jgi:replicative DNA helicase